MRCRFHCTPSELVISLAGVRLERRASALVETVAKSSGLMSNIINDMLDYSRLEDGSLMLELRPFEYQHSSEKLPTLLFPWQEARASESGRQCLATLVQLGSMYKLVILDLWMPEMDGYEVAIRIQKNIRVERRPLVVALTADTDKSTQERCLKVVMDGVILKPVSLAEISSKLCKILLRAKRFHGSD
ncbi:hypothetical protein L7F22_040083 [Adiantum nelumboides]|nr:hypothetical protein [Adiantum nelumboides]